MDNKRAFLIFFPLVLVFTAFYHDFLWIIQILTFSCLFFFLGLDFRKKPSGVLILLILTLFVSTYFSINRIYSVPVLFSYITIFILSSSNKEKVKDLLKTGYIAGTSIIGAISVIYTSVKTLSVPIPPSLAFFENSGNYIIPYFGHAFYGVLIVASIPFVLEKVTYTKTGRRWLLIFIFYVILLFSTFSKAAILVGLLEIVGYYAINRFKNKQNSDWNVIGIPVVIGISAGILLWFGLQKSLWLQSKIIKSSVESRVEYWQQDFRALKNSTIPQILFGHGLGNFPELSRMYQSRPDYWTTSSHNFLIQFFIECGLVPFTIFIFYFTKTIKDNFNSYSLSEKICLFSLLAFSFGSTVDLNFFPVLLLFFVILNKERDEKFRKISLRNVVLWIISLLTLFIWGKYVYAYFYYSFTNKPGIAFLEVFPYESGFWEKTIDRSVNDTKMTQISSLLLGKYSTIDTTLSKSIAKKAITIGDKCEALEISKKYVSIVPYDLEFQKILVSGLYDCPKVNDELMMTFFKTLKPNYGLPRKDLETVLPFFMSIARYYYIQKEWEEYEYWFKKVWVFEEDNKKNIWFGSMILDKYSSLPVKGPFRLILSQDSKNDLAGIGIINRPNTNETSYKPSYMLFIGTRGNGKVLYIDIKKLNTSEINILFERKYIDKVGLINLLFNSFGTLIDILDSNNNLIERLDVNKLTNNLFPDGLFESGEMYFSYGVASKSTLDIQDILITPL